MKNIDVLMERYHLPKEEIFEMVLGNGGGVLPGKLWHAYGVVVADNEMICYTVTEDQEFHIPYQSFQKAEFGIGNGNLWLQCVIDGKELVFCSPRKQWKSSVGKRLIEKISAVIPVESMKEYNAFTGKLFFLHMFK